MSHSTCLVIGSDIEAQLQPFHEFECTGMNDQFVQDVDVTQECRERGLGWHGLEDLTVTDESKVDRDDAHKYGYAVVDSEGNLIKAVKRTNPNKKWDWWVVGGRWSGFFKLKDGATGSLGEPGLMGSCRSAAPNRADQCTKGSIDIAGMRDDAGREAGEHWDKASAAANGLAWESWVKCRDDLFKDDIQAARDFYNGQAPVKAIKAAFDDFFLAPDTFQVSREEYVNTARNRALSTYAVLYKGEWSARGEMGWFGISDDKVSEADWSRLFNELIDGLPDDTLLTVVDCHI